MQGSADTKIRFYVTDGTAAMTAVEVSESYFREGLASGHGGVRVDLLDGTSDLIAGCRYLPTDTHVRAEVVDGRLEIIYLGEVMRAYLEWRNFETVTLLQYPLGRS